MGTVLLPLVVVLIAGLVVLGLIIAERYPVSTWKDGLRDLRDVARDKSEPMQVVPQDAKLSEFITHEQATTYMGTESISGLVEVVEKAMDSAEKAVDSAEARTAALRGKAGHHPGRPSPSGSSPDPAGAPAQTVPAPVAPAPAPPLVRAPGGVGFWLRERFAPVRADSVPTQWRPAGCRAGAFRCWGGLPLLGRSGPGPPAVLGRAVRTARLVGDKMS